MDPLLTTGTMITRQGGDSEIAENLLKENFKGMAVLMAWMTCDLYGQAVVPGTYQELQCSPTVLHQDVAVSNN